MNDTTQGKGISGGLLLAIFLAVGLVVSILLVKSFENQLAAETDAFAADYAAGFEEPGDAAAGDAAMEDAAEAEPAPGE